MKRRRGEPFTFGYEKGHVRVSVAAVPFSQYLRPGESVEDLASELLADHDRRWNREPLSHRYPRH